jgi:hypothetical protein
MKITVDGREVEDFQKTLAKVASGPVLKDITAVVAKGALNIKRDAAKRAGGMAHAPAYPRSITYDLRAGWTGPYADIGPDKQKRQGALGNVLEYGTVNNPPHPHLRPAADAEQPRFEKAIEDLVARPLEGR